MSDGWSGFDLSTRDHSSRFSLSETHVRERIKQLKANPKVTVLIETEHLFIWRQHGLYAYIHRSLVE